MEEQQLWKELQRILPPFEESIYSDCLDNQDVFGRVQRLIDNASRLPEDYVLQRMGQFTSPLCAVAVVRVEDRSQHRYDKLHRALSEGTSGDYLRKRLLETMNDLSQVLFVHKNGDLVMMIDYCGSSRSDGLMEETGRRLTYMVMTTEAQTDMLLRITLSRVFDGLEQLPRAYEQACRLQDYTMLFSEETQVFTMGDFLSSRHRVLNTVPPEEVLGRYLSLLVSGDYDGACELMLMMVTNYAMVDLYHPATIRQYTDQLLMLASAVCHPPRVEILPHRQQLVDIETIQSDIIEYFTRLVQTQEHEEPTMADRLAEYIQQHYGDSSLDVSALSRAFSINLSYMSRIFKRDMGVSPLMYLQSVRVRAAKELLLDPRLTVSAVAEQVGYLSAWTLTRAFKRLEGMTPGQYRSAFSEGTEAIAPNPAAVS